MDELEKSINTEKKKTKRRFQGVLQFVQHALISAAAFAMLVVITGSTIFVRDLYGNNRYTYTLWETNTNEEYENTEIFYRIFKQSISEVIRFGVIRSQLETDGEFDGKKVIDVTAYNYRSTKLPSQYVTAEYYLEDLLKWENYGLEYNSYSMNDAESDEFFKEFFNDVSANSLPKDIPEKKNGDSEEDRRPASSVENSEELNELEEVEEMAAEETRFVITEVIDEPLNYNILVNRYKTTDGKNIEGCVSDLNSYSELCDNVIMAMQSLAYNYDEYSVYKEYYDSHNTNIRYCIEKTVDGHTEYLTNMIDNSVDGTVSNTQIKDIEDVADFFDTVFDGKLNGKMSRYLYYSPDEMIYESNSGIAEDTLRDMIKDYSYAYPENIRLWIGVDSSYSANDAISDGYEGYKNYVPFLWKYTVFAILAVAIYIILFIYLTITTGREVDEEGNKCIRLTGFDKEATEAALILGALSAFVIVNALHFSLHILTYSLVETIGFKILAAAAVFVIDIIFLFFYYSLVRRIKAKTLWKNSYLRRLLKKCYSIILELYGNSNIVARTWGPYILFLLFNIMMAVCVLIMAYSEVMVLLIVLITVAVDIIIGMLLYRDVKERQDIINGIEKIAEGDFSYHVEQNKMHGYNTKFAKSVNSIGNGIRSAVEVSMKDERMKTELITNVSHDIKTPLTSIINYVDLIKREEIDNERVRGYIQILDEKSQRLKQLTDDLVEASKISSGNINLSFEKINLTELLNQTLGEFSEKFEQKKLSIVMNINVSNAVIETDSRRIWCIMENLFNNIYKYALEGTRVYITVEPLQKEKDIIKEWVKIAIKNISSTELNCNPEELTERFIRGDESRTTEGSGLGLSIAKNLTEAQKGTFEIQLDGDLFKIIMTFPLVQG